MFRPLFLHSEGEIVWLWHFLLNFLVFIACNFNLLWLSPLTFSVDRYKGWFQHSILNYLFWLSVNSVNHGYLCTEGCEINLWYLLLNFCVHISCHLILLVVHPLKLSADRDRWWFEPSVSQFWGWLSVERALIVSSLWMLQIKGFYSLNRVLIAKVLVIYSSPFHLATAQFTELNVDREEW